MRKLTFALAVGLLFTAGAIAAPRPAAAATFQTKVVIVVGQVQSVTASYRSDADQIASEFLKFTSNVTKVYSPGATWSAVSAAAKGANVLVYLGHGSGYPNPYVSYFQPNYDNGMGLDGSIAGRTYYSGENYMAQLQLAPNALVILNHLCYASGDNEWGLGAPTLSTARTRVEGYASGFLRGGAGAVLAEGTNSLTYYVDTLFGANRTIDSMWKSAPSSNSNYSTWSNSRNPRTIPQIDPDLPGHTAPDGDPYYRSLVGMPGLTTAQVISGQAAPFVAQSGSYYPIAPTRVIDTRMGAVGPTGTITSRGATNYQIAGLGGVPTNAIGITANVTVTGQSANGWLYIGPTINAQPASSTINVKVGDNRANGVTVGLSPRGTVAVWYGASAGRTTNFIIDVTGYFLSGTAGAGYVRFGPQRVLDSRIAGSAVTRLASGHHQTFKIAGVAGLPSSGIVAVAGNLTIVKPSAGGYVTLGPNPTDTPNSSTINFPRGDIRANNVIVPINANGTLSVVYVAPAGSTVNVVLDISGYFTASGGYLYHSMQPARIMDSRVPLPANFTKFISKTAQKLPVMGSGGVPSGAVAIVGNMTVTAQTYGGWAAIGPVVDATTNFSNLNFPVGDTRANGVTVPLASDGSVKVIYVGGTGTSAQLILDVCGYYLGAA